MTERLVEIDGSMGEGGGQILRSSVALSLITGRPCRIEEIRAGRKRPGLLRQHLTAVKAAAQVGQAEVKGAQLGSRQLTFAPRSVAAGEYRFSVGSAGSATLVLQTVLPALLTASGTSRLVLEGGTHNPFAPPFDFLERAFLPCIRQMGPSVHAVLERPGFYPAGGGAFHVDIEPARDLSRLDLLERGAVKKKRARAFVANLPSNIADRELETVGELLGWDREELCVVEVENALGPGNVLTLEVESEAVTEVFTGFGERGVAAASVARRAVDEARRYFKSGVPVGEHLADQLLLPMALAGGGSFRTLHPSRHTRTNIDVLKAFLDVDFELTEEARDSWRVEIKEH